MEALTADNLIAGASAQKADRKTTVFLAKKRARLIEKKLLVSDKHITVNAALRRVCYLLHELLQKYAFRANIAHNDFATLIHCGHILREMGLKPKTNPLFDQTAADLRLDIIRSSFDYRNVRNKMLASLAIIADLPERSAGHGTPEYQRGMREGYRRASEIAISFLDDLLEEN